MRQINLEDFEAVFTQGVGPTEADPGAGVVDSRCAMQIGDTLVPDEWLTSSVSDMRTALTVSHFGAFLAGALAYKRVVDEALETADD